MPLLTMATCRNAHLFAQEPDDQLLQNVLHKAGIATELVAWDDPTYDWSKPALVLIRSTWDYPSNYKSFLSWVRLIASQTTLWNPSPLVHWNAHKTYLRELERLGIPIIPTVWLPTLNRVRLPVLMQSTGWKQVVIKPVVGTSGRQARVITAQTLEEGQVHLDILLQSGEAMVQPFLPSFYASGERSLIFIDGHFTHAMRKRFSLVQGLDQQGLMPVTADPEELTFAERVLQKLSLPVLFARVDLVRDHQHRLLLNELEVIEPVLFLAHSDSALQRLTDTCLDRLSHAAERRQPMPEVTQKPVNHLSSGSEVPEAEPRQVPTAIAFW